MNQTSRCQPAALHRDRGLSLLELLVAMAILALSLTLLYQVQGGLLRGTEDLSAGRKANLLLRALLNSRDAVPASGWTESGEIGELQWQVRSRPWPKPPALPEDAVPLHEVTFVISWSSRRGPGQLVVTTLLPQALSPPGAPA